ncbi:MAG: SUMF1/EgtB/PvdO family nonheme iron enzyme, partial [FCB group bacterium]
QFDTYWANSWRSLTGPSNYDAAWIFVKYKKTGMGSDNNWHHATLSNNFKEYSILTDNGVPASFAPDSNGKGVFLYRKQLGIGDNTWQGTRIVWDIQKDNIKQGDDVQLRIFAIEMVYIPEGSFYLGDGTSVGRFYTGGNPNAPYKVTATPPILSNTNGVSDLWADASVNSLPSGDNAPPAWDNPGGNQTLNPSYPSGYHGFYIMKYELSQGLYTAFLNTITSNQAKIYFMSEDILKGYAGLPFPYRARNTINVDLSGTFVCTAPTRAENWIGWEDQIAFADWAALRPVTEMEYEKACRGADQQPNGGEYSWGTTDISSVLDFIGVDGSGTETPSPPESNTLYNRTIQGPIRVGIHEGKKPSRVLSGSTYYGVMDMTGNVSEQVVTLGTSQGRLFIGNNGDGELDTNGAANVPFWPRAVYNQYSIDNKETYWPWVKFQGQQPVYNGLAGGYGYKGGDWLLQTTFLQACRVSDRRWATYATPRRLPEIGFRAARNAPPPPDERAIELRVPNGGELWHTGSSYKIEWTNYFLDNVKIEYSLNSGGTWNTIIPSYSASSQSFTWAVPYTPSTTCKIRLSDVDDYKIFDISDSVFTIAVQDNQSIKVTTPNGGEDWTIGTNQIISWESAEVDNVKIEYTTNNGSKWKLIASSVPATSSSFSWIIPNTPSSICRVKISDASNASLYDLTDGYFTIRPATVPIIKIITPGKGEQLTGNSTYNISWISQNIDTLVLYYSIDLGINWINIVTISSYFDNYDWKVPNILSDSCKIKIISQKDSSIFDETDSTFSITPKDVVPDDSKYNLNIQVNENYEILISFNLDIFSFLKIDIFDLRGIIKSEL